MASISSTSLAVTLAHAVSYLTRPLRTYYGSATVNKLQCSLEASLAAVYVSTWNPSAPLNGSGRRCLTFSPNHLPPRPVYNACAAAEVEWSHWSRALGDTEFDMFIDPGNVAIRFNHPTSGTFSKLVTIWSAQIEAEEQMQMQVKQQQQQRQVPQKKTLAQQLIEEDQAEEDVLFSMLADELREPAYITPIIDQFPTVPVSRVALGHSRSSSRSSLYSCSSDESLTSCGTFSSGTSLTSSSNSSSSDASSAKKQSRRERARQARVFVDKSKNEVTPYDGGKTTVLTGGVMLGGVAGKKTRCN